MKRFLFLLFLTLPWILQGQTLTPEVVVTSGGLAQGSSGSLSFSIGECITETCIRAFGTLTQGFQQSSLEVINTVGKTDADFGLSVFPVPAENMLTIEVRNFCSGLTVTLFDLTGKEVIREELFSPATELDLGSFPGGEYILRVTGNSGSIIGSFTIIKH